MPLFLFIVSWRLWMIHIRTSFVKNIQWKLLEMKIPKEILKTPKAMEQVFASLYSSYSYGPNKYAKYWDGKVEPWFSFEMVGYSGGVYFYVYVPAGNKNMVESSVYSQYPDAEINEIDDYTELLPAYLPNEVYDIWGTELHLANENYLPIRTYFYFEESDEDKRLDPLSAIAEAMSKLKKDEMIWLQFLISPTGEQTGNEWIKEGREKIDEIVGRKKDEKKKEPFLDVYAWAKNFLWAPVEHPTWPSDDKKKEEGKAKILSPDEQELVKAIDNKISRLGFEAFIRFVYIDRQDSFSPANVGAIMGAFHQFNIQNLNRFKPKNLTVFDSLLARIFPRYKNFRVLSKKRKMFDYYKQRRFGKYNKTREEEFSILNTEELATIFHFPTIMVGAPKIRRAEAKKGSPPPGLPIE